MKTTPEAPERGPFTRLLLDNLPLKLLAFVLSIALFSLVHSDQDAQRAMYVDVVALLPPPHADKMLVSEIPSQAKVTLRGSRSRITALQHDDFAPIQMDLRDPARRYYYFDAAAIDVPGAVQVVGIEPAAVELAWASSSERKVPVRARLRGAPDEGFMVKKPIVIVPGSVTIHGPTDEIGSVHEVFTEDISIDGMAAGTYDRRVQLEPLSGHITYLDPAATQVHIEVVPELGDRVLRKLEVAVVGAGGASLRPSVVSVALRGPVRALGELEPEELVPYVELPAAAVAEQGLLPLEVKLRGLPEGFEIVRVLPPSVLAKRHK